MKLIYDHKMIEGIVYNFDILIYYKYKSKTNKKILTKLPVDISIPEDVHVRMINKICNPKNNPSILPPGTKIEYAQIKAYEFKK